MSRRTERERRAAQALYEQTRICPCCRQPLDMGGAAIGATRCRECLSHTQTCDGARERLRERFEADGEDDPRDEA